MFLFDTCAVSDFVMGMPFILNKIKMYHPSDFFISAINVMEIEYGLQKNPGKAKKVKPIIDHLISSMTILPFAALEANTAGHIRVELMKKGTPIGPYDLLIAATALTHELILITSNTKEFKRVKGLKIEDWR